MARKTTANLALGTWAEGEHPGAGSQDVAGGAGLNDNWLILDAAVGAAHTSAGAHKDDTIHKTALHSDCVDGATLTKDAVNKYLKVMTGGITDNELDSQAVTASKIAADVAGDGLGQAGGGALKVNVDASTIEIVADTVKVKDAGIGTTQLADNAVTAIKITDGVITAAKLASAMIGPGLQIGGGVLYAHTDNVTVGISDTDKLEVPDNGIGFAQLNESDIFDNVTLDWSATKIRVKDDGITAPKISHDNKRTQHFFTCAVATAADGTYAKCAGELMTSTVGVPMPQAGSVVAVTVCNGNGVVDTFAFPYGERVFAQGNKLHVRINNIASIWNVVMLKNGSSFIGAGDMEMTGTATAPLLISVCMEFDD